MNTYTHTYKFPTYKADIYLMIAMCQVLLYAKYTDSMNPYNIFKGEVDTISIPFLQMGNEGMER